MKELIQQLNTISDAYDDFILGTINYAKKDPSHIEILKGFINGKANLTSSEVISFIMSQPDFHNYSAAKIQFSYLRHSPVSINDLTRKIDNAILNARKRGEWKSE